MRMLNNKNMKVTCNEIEVREKMTKLSISAHREAKKCK